MKEMMFVYKNLFEKRVINALDDKVICEIKNLSTEYHVEYKYSELSSRVTIGRISNVMWTNIGWYLVIAFGLFVVFAKILFPEYFYNPVNRIFPLSLLGLSLIAFSLQLIFKYDCIWINDKEGNTAMSFRLTKHNHEQGKKVKDFIVNNIQRAENKLAKSKNEGKAK